MGTGRPAAGRPAPHPYIRCWLLLTPSFASLKIQKKIKEREGGRGGVRQLQLLLSQEEGPCASGTTACTTCNVIDHGMESSRSSSQLTDGGAAGGVVWLDEPLGFLFLSFLDLRSCTGGGTSCVGGHGLGGIKSSMHVVIPVNTSWCLRCCSMT